MSWLDWIMVPFGALIAVTVLFLFFYGIWDVTTTWLRGRRDRRGL
jgi:uncharacterized protein (DUF2062 family)